MTLPLADRLSLIRPSATVAIAQRAKELQAQGIDVLSFSVGQPDFDTPEHIRDAAKRAIDEGATRYTAARGVLPLRQAICDASERRRGVAHKPSEVVVSVGAKHTLFNLAMVLYQPGDEVIIPAPYWVSYPEQVRMAGATPKIVETSVDDGFRLTPETLQSALNPSTKAVLLCTPSNPTGAAYSKAELRALADVLADHDCWIIVDEIYGELVYAGFEQESLLTVAPELRDRIIVVDGVSKTYAMTGWRIGWMLAPAHVAGAVDKIQGQSTTNPTAAAQHAAIEALNGPQVVVAEMRFEFEQRRKFIVDGLRSIEGIECRLPEGAFYAFADMRGLVGKSFQGKPIADDLELAAFLLEEARCAFVPGTAFGAPGFMRISYAVSREQIKEGIARIRAAVAQLT